MDNTNMDSFFPSTDYKIPESSNYMKFKEGDNNFRVLSSAIIGWEYWNTDNKPVRSEVEFEGIPTDIKMTKNQKGEEITSPISHFWAFAVWNLDAKRVQILEIKQKGIMEYMQSLIKNPKWGSPKGYDLCVNRKGSGFDTEYTTIASPHSELDPKIKEQFSKMNLDLTELYVGGDPFKS